MILLRAIADGIAKIAPVGFLQRPRAALAQSYGIKQQKGAPMTISSSLSAGVAGLNANATGLPPFRQHRHSGTYGYKRAAADFSNMVITNAKGAGVYSAGGVRASSSA